MYIYIYIAAGSHRLFELIGFSFWPGRESFLSFGKRNSREILTHCY